MNLLKLGGMNMQPERWLDALSVFDGVCFLTTYREEPEVPGIKYIKPYGRNVFRSFLSIITSKFNEIPFFEPFLDLLYMLFRKMASKDLLVLLKSNNYDEVHVSHNDFDDSAFLLVLLKPYLKKDVRITRAYKESRPVYKYLEKKAFQFSNRIVLNEPENIDFFTKKYGSDFFDGKDIVTGIDEDVIGVNYIKKVKYAEKLSLQDGRPHIVILAGRVMSDSSDARSGSRLYYVPLIKSFLEKGFSVHLHTLKVVPDANGINQYEILEEKYKGNFFIEKPLSFNENDFVDSFYILSRYDFGILHNYIEGTSNSEFDKYNIPHRYYEYLLAHVIPILQKNKTIVLERIFNETNSGFVYSSPEEIKLNTYCNFSFKSFKDYIRVLYAE